MGQYNGVRDMKSTFSEFIGLKATNQTYSVLELRGTHEDLTKWRVTFQQIPEKSIIIDGLPPTRDELVDAMTGSMLPVIMVPLMEIIIDYVLTHPNKVTI